MENLIGPILTDEELFEALNSKDKRLQQIKKSIPSVGIDRAKADLCDYVRGTLNKEAFFKIPSKKQPDTLSDSLRAEAERALEHYMISCGTPMKFEGPVDWFANPTFNQYKEWTWQLSRHPEITNAARAYYITKDEKYAEGAVELLHSWIKQAVRPESDVGSYQTLCWRTIEAGIRLLHAWPLIIHALIDSPAMTDEVLIDVLKSLYEHGVRLEEHPTHGNWLIMELDGLINLGLMFPYFEKSERWLARSVETFAKEMTSQIHLDGFQYELTTNYHSVVMTNTMTVIEVLEAYDYKVPEEMYDALNKMTEVYIKLRMSGGLIPDINDGRMANIKSFVARYISLYPDKEIAQFIMTDGKEGKKPEYLTTVLENSGVVALRRDWEINSTTAIFDGGKFGRGHQHEDKLNLLIYSGGKVIITEGNNYAYDDSEMRRYVLSTYAHNTVTVNNMGQNRRSTFKWCDEMISSVEPLTVERCESFDRAQATYDEGYGKDLYQATHTREVIFVKSPKVGEPYFIVTDLISAEDENEYQVLWHINSEDIEIEGKKAENDEIKMLFDGDICRIDKIKGQEGPIFQGFTARSAKQLDYYAIPTVIPVCVGKTVRSLSVICPKANAEAAVSTAKLEGNKVIITYNNAEKEAFDVI